MKIWALSCVLAICAGIGCAAAGGSGNTNTKESSKMELSGSRKPPPTVAPLEIGGVRFEQVMDTTGIDTDDHRGWMRATDIASGNILWTRQVYKTENNGVLESSSGLVYFTSMSPGADGVIIVENETGARFSVDVTNGDATALK